jgi:hypothetical protein
MNYPIAPNSLSLCPFCSGKPCHLQQEDLHKIRCTHCGAEIKAQTSDNAVRAWNIRARSRQTPMEVYKAQLKAELSPENYLVACGVLDHLIRETIGYLKRREFLPPREPVPTGAPDFWWRHLDPTDGGASPEEIMARLDQTERPDLLYSAFKGPSKWAVSYDAREGRIVELFDTETEAQVYCDALVGRRRAAGLRRWQNEGLD